MILASLLSAGASREEVLDHLSGLGLQFDLETGQTRVNGISATRLSVAYPEQHHHRTFTDIEALIENAGLPGRVAERSLDAFHRLAVAEGRIHGQEPQGVPFHEVGAVDSIVDVVGSCVALESLGIDTVSCGPLPMGNGVVRAEHGTIPVPGPATLEILKGSSVRWTGEPQEMTTPTGAALMCTFTGGEFTEAAPQMLLYEVGYGTGHKQFENTPNLLRAVVGEVEALPEEVRLLEANVDDAPGEILGAAVEHLMRAGALDAWLEPITMKRGRGAYKVCALARLADVDQITRVTMMETGTLGVRHHRVGRTVAGRRTVEVELPYGKCRVKIGKLDGEDYVVSPEYSDAAYLAEKSGAPLARIYDEVKVALAKQKPEGKSSGLRFS